MQLATLREVPGEAEVSSHIWLLRSGMIRKLVSGVYGFMPLGYRTLRKIEQIVREEMDRAGAQEIHMSAIQPAELWMESGRWFAMGPEMWRVKDRHGRDFCLGPTHEEVFTDIVRNVVSSYRQLPLNLYQIQPKYRDEARPRFGLMRSREFVMKDAYSFDRDIAGLNESYRVMCEAYTRIFDRCGLDYVVVDADSGAMGGSGSQEFTALSDIGESDIVYCACGFAATAEQAPGMDAPAEDEEMLPMEEVLTPGAKSIEAVAEYIGLPEEKTLKALLFAVYDDGDDGDGGGDNALGCSGHGAAKEYVAVFVRGDRALNLLKLRNVLGVPEHLIAFADEAAMGPVTGSVAGFTGPAGLHDCRIIVDSEVPGLKNLCAGACKEDAHIRNVNYGRDYTADLVADLKLVKAGDPCPACGKPLGARRGIEVGQVFKLGTKYSDSMRAYYRDENMEEHPILMGSYGIGVTRTMAAVVEQHHDEDGIIWPMAVAPYQVIVCPVKNGDEAVRGLAEEIYAKLLAEGAEALIDDRDERPGVKFKDADMIGVPIRITVGKRAPEGVVEYRLRAEKTSAEISADEAVARAAAAIRAGAPAPR
jgi:prolyl-tRNA synthetase